MRVVLFTICWNDMAMLRFFFRHYDRFVSRYVIFDEGSTDGSADLIRSHPRAELRHFVRSHPDSFALSEQQLSDECWKGEDAADYVIVTDIDEHLYHADTPALLSRYKAEGVTLVPALGYQMVSEEFPEENEVLCETRMRGAPWANMCKISIFDPSAITEINFEPGRHEAKPEGRLVVPERDEMLLLHYKYMGFQRTYARHLELRSGLRSKDEEKGWGHKYRWTETQLREDWGGVSKYAVDISALGPRPDVGYPVALWWKRYPGAGAEALASEPKDSSNIEAFMNEVDALLFDFLLRNDLHRSSVVLDMQPGRSTAESKLAEFLGRSCYFCIDISRALTCGDSRTEPRAPDLRDEPPKENSLRDSDLGFAEPGARFDVAIAQSLFTQLQGPHVRLCLEQLSRTMGGGGRLFATFFLVPENHPVGAPCEHPKGIVSFDDQEPYHYRFSQLRAICKGLPWVPVMMGEWGHPRDQRMVLFSISSEDEPTGALSVDQAEGRSAHRAPLGLPDHYDFMSSSQFSLLCALGLRERHSVLELGCGPLQLGRLLIPFLRARSYFGIDPDRRLLEDTIEAELGYEIVGLKLPSFSFNDDLASDVFSQKFDYIVAQSAFRHAGPDFAGRLLIRASEALATGGKLIFCVCEAEDFFQRPAASGWVYPDGVKYGTLEVQAMCQQAGLHCLKLFWYCPEAVWYVAAHDPADLPPVSERWLLRGAVLFDPQFEASRALSRS